MPPGLLKRCSEMTPQVLSCKLSPGNTCYCTCKNIKKMKMATENEAICGHCAYSQGLSEISILYGHMAHSVLPLISAWPEGEGGLCGQEDSNLFLVSERCFPIWLQTNEFVSLCLSSQPAWSKYNTSSLWSSSATSICDTILQGRKTTASHMCMYHTKQNWN